MAAVLKLAGSLGEATESANKLVVITKSVYETVAGVLEKSDEAYKKQMKEQSSIQSAEANDFREAMRDSKTSGEAIQQRCKELSDDWNDLETKIRRSLAKRQIDKRDVNEIILSLQQMLQSSARCGEHYQEFREQLQKAITIASRLVEKSKEAVENTRSEANNTKLVGNACTGVLTAAAAGFLVLASGGIALIGAAAAGAAVVGAEALTSEKVSKLDKLAKELDEQKATLQGSIGDLNKLGDSVTEMIKISENMAEKIEISLKIYKERLDLALENEELREEMTQLKLEMSKKSSKKSKGKNCRTM